MKYFYARVSTREQNLDRQIEAAKPYGIDRMFCDKQSGKNFDRPQYQLMKSEIKEGDILYIKELDRLGRDKEGVKAEIKWFKDRGVRLRIMDIPTSMAEYPEGQEWIGDMVNNILIEVLGAIAEQERKKTKQRQREGIDAMKIVDGRHISAKSGRPMGKPQIEIPNIGKFLEMQKNGILTVDECCGRLGISRATWFRRASAV